MGQYKDYVKCFFSIGHNKEKYELHNPYEKILLRQFVNNLIVLAYHMYKEEAEE